MKCIVVAALVIASVLGEGQVIKSGLSDNVELSQLFKVDQAEREGTNVDYTALYKHDVERRNLLRKLLTDGKVRTGTDYYHAAMVFQHGQNPDDYLLAHVLAVTAIEKGSQKARWLSAATLDRYLRSIWQPQIYGTQFTKPDNLSAWQHESMNLLLVSDSMRSASCVTTLPQQQAALPRAGSTDFPGRTSVPDCK